MNSQARFRSFFHPKNLFGPVKSIYQFLLRLIFLFFFYDFIINNTRLQRKLNLLRNLNLLRDKYGIENKTISFFNVKYFFYFIIISVKCIFQ